MDAVPAERFVSMLGFKKNPVAVLRASHTPQEAPCQAVGHG